MTDTELLSQTEHISDIFTRIMFRTMTVDLLSGHAPGSSGGISLAQFQALRQISQHGQSTIGTLAEGLGISQPAATMLVDRMVRRGLLARKTGTRDRRQSQLTLTGRAVKLLARAEAERTERLARVLDCLTPAEREQLVRSLERFVAAALALEASADEACLRCGLEHDSECVVNRARMAVPGGHEK